jgi:hypothetical protein
MLDRPIVLLVSAQSFFFLSGSSNLTYPYLIFSLFQVFHDWQTDSEWPNFDQKTVMN